MVSCESFLIFISSNQSRKRSKWWWIKLVSSDDHQQHTQRRQIIEISEEMLDGKLEVVIEGFDQCSIFHVFHFYDEWIEKREMINISRFSFSILLIQLFYHIIILLSLFCKNISFLRFNIQLFPIPPYQFYLLQPNQIQPPSHIKSSISSDLKDKRRMNDFMILW